MLLSHTYQHFSPAEFLPSTPSFQHSSHFITSCSSYPINIPVPHLPTNTFFLFSVSPITHRIFFLVPIHSPPHLLPLHLHPLHLSSTKISFHLTSSSNTARPHPQQQVRSQFSDSPGWQFRRPLYVNGKSVSLIWT